MLNAPLNGPSSSFMLSQDGLSIYNNLNTVFLGVNNAPKIFDPEDITITMPVLPLNMTMFLPQVSLVFHGNETVIPATSLPISANSDTYFRVTYTGLGYASDFTVGSLTLASSGQYAGLYAPTGNFLVAQSPVSISDGQKLTMQWTGQNSSNNSWGPAILDYNGNGYAIAGRSTHINLYKVFNYTLNGMIQSINTTVLASSGYHQMILDISFLGEGVAPRSFSYQLDLFVDSANQPLTHYEDTSAYVAPTRMLPSFYSFVPTNVHLKTWSWQHPTGVPTAAWGYSVSTFNGPAPLADNSGAREIFKVSAATVPLSIVNLLDRGNIATRIESLRDTISQIKAAYI